MQSPPSTASSDKDETTSSSPSNSSPSPPPPAPPTSPPPESPPPVNSPPPSKESSPPSSPPPSASESPPPPSDSTTTSLNAPEASPPTSSKFNPPPPVSSGSPSLSAGKLSPPPPSEKSAPFEKPDGAQHSGKPAAGSSGNNNGSPSSNSGSSDMFVVTGIAVAGLMIFATIIVCLIYWRRKKKEHYYTNPPPGPSRRPPKGSTDPYYKGPKPMEHIIKVPTTVYTSNDSTFAVNGQALVPSPSLGGFSKSQFTYEELARATSGFSKANLLGQGGFGYVHKGVLVDGTVVAVKSLKSGSGQGEREFQAEVDIISRVHHRHLVSLVGYCIADRQRMLVYEYVPNKTLEFHLHGKGHRVMDWGTRLKIALGSAKGLAYLHEDCIQFFLFTMLPFSFTLCFSFSTLFLHTGHPKIIHRDIKAANILLEDNFEAKVADFGLAKLSSDNLTHVSTRVMGTFGYMAPEYASSGKLTDRSDVFSFGIVLLELITGKRPIDPSNIMEDSLVEWARPLLKTALEEGKYDELVGAPFEGNNVPKELHRLVVCAAASTRYSAKRRPKMTQIMRALDGDSSLEDMSDGAKTDTYDTSAYNADMIKFREMISNQEFNSSEYGGTSDYGLNPSSSSGDSSELDHHQRSRG
ncbi:proline-rich receptor-like protein kinase PERK5 isoform X2 [Solanum lycopersicum]|uniref:proline-rich receptor-like protein kinase PERK5 isoform X2 n=1 Tax=Solanum lycopersicum TaxID=4081 RepID=UPI000E1CD36C|nr:proline-rich receptor-like protein kinase PERK5 isoform X2 [Solanum lycopersicum]